jgi:hypothetical protein
MAGPTAGPASRHTAAGEGAWAVVTPA